MQSEKIPQLSQIAAISANGHHDFTANAPINAPGITITANKPVKQVANTDGIELSTAETDQGIGISMEGGVAADWIDVATDGARIRVTASAAIQVGALVTATTSSKMVTVGFGGTYACIFGYALTAASTGDDTFIMQVRVVYFKV